MKPSSFVLYWLRFTVIFFFPIFFGVYRKFLEIRSAHVGQKGNTRLVVDQGLGVPLLNLLSMLLQLVFCFFIFWTFGRSLDAGGACWFLLHLEREMERILSIQNKKQISAASSRSNSGRHVDLVKKFWMDMRVYCRVQNVSWIEGWQLENQKLLLFINEWFIMDELKIKLYACSQTSTSWK